MGTGLSKTERLSPELWPRPGLTVHPLLSGPLCVSRTVHASELMTSQALTPHQGLLYAQDEDRGAIACGASGPGGVAQCDGEGSWTTWAFLSVLLLTAAAMLAGPPRCSRPL